MVIISLLQARPHDGAPARLAAVESSLLPGQSTPLHVHVRDEAVQVTQGSVTIHHGERTADLRVGDALLLPGGAAHTIRAGALGARIRSASYVVSVARYEDFLHAVARPGGGLSAQDGATLEAIAGTNGISVVGPPGALPSTVREAAA